MFIVDEIVGFFFVDFYYCDVVKLYYGERKMFVFDCYGFEIFGVGEFVIWDELVLLFEEIGYVGVV